MSEEKKKETRSWKDGATLGEVIGDSNITIIVWCCFLAPCLYFAIPLLLRYTDMWFEWKAIWD